MIQLSESAQAHFRRLIEREALPGLGVRLSAVHPGTSRADVRLEFAEPAELGGDEWAVDCDGFTLWIDAASAQYLDAAEIDFVQQPTGGALQIRAPKIKGEAPADTASLVERVRWVVEHEINPQLAEHRGHVAVQEVSADGVVLLRFGGGCHGCGMADVTLKQGIESTLMTRVPGVTAVRDATDHATGAAPYLPRDAA
jgi:Fe/S biogenesis protein NfuA